MIDNPTALIKRKKIKRLPLRGMQLQKPILDNLLKLISDRSMEYRYYRDGNDGIIDMIRRIKRGRVDVRLSTLVVMAELIGVDVILKEREDVCRSFVDSDGYIIVERMYCPYIRLKINPDDYKDFRLWVGIYDVKLASVYACYRALYLYYYKSKVTSRMLYHVKNVIKVSLGSGDGVVTDVKGSEHLYRGKKDL